MVGRETFKISATVKDKVKITAVKTASYRKSLALKVVK